MSNNFSFTIDYCSKNCAARVGIITTPHGDIKTPSFVAVGTQGSVKSLTSSDLDNLGVQIFFVNTYHILVRPGPEVIKKMAGLHKFISWKGPLFTDSGGFQIFSLGKRDSPTFVKINDKGVTFRSHWDGNLYEITPEKSLELQHLLGADLMIAFDDCAPYPVSYEKAKESLRRTNDWAVRSLKTHEFLQKKSAKYQALYGSIQGSVFADLRKEAAKFIAGFPFDGFAIGGVAVGESKTQMENALKWVIPSLPLGKPRHLLGVGEIDDIFTLVKYGIDTFDCVMPTRLARTGQLLIKNSKLKIKNLRSAWKMDITKSIYALDKKPIEPNCQCYTCKTYSRSYLHHLFRVRELSAYRLATIHNIYFIEELMVKIRQAIKEDQLGKVQKEYLE